MSKFWYTAAAAPPESEASAQSTAAAFAHLLPSM
jgi:hypothetical protein